MQSKLIWRTLLTEASAEDKEGVGNLRTSGGNIYRYVVNKDTSNALALGDIAFHKLSDAENLEKYVYQGATANLGVMAGVVVATDGLAAYTTTSVSYGWIQVFGNCPSASVINATSGGADIAAGSYLKGVNGVNYATFDAATQPAYKRSLQILAAFTKSTGTDNNAAALKRCFVSCL